DVARSVIGAKRSCVPTMPYAANRAWQLLGVLAFNLMVVFSSRPRPVARPASGAVAFRFETIHTLPYPLSAPCRSPQPFSATLGIDGKGADRQERESLNGPTNPPARDRSLVRGRPLTSLWGRGLSAGRAPLGGHGKTAPGIGPEDWMRRHALLLILS